MRAPASLTSALLPYVFTSVSMLLAKSGCEFAMILKPSTITVTLVLPLSMPYVLKRERPFSPMAPGL